MSPMSPRASPVSKTFFKKLGKSLDKLKSPMLEKALEFLDDKLLEATSNAVERANRRFRKAQKSIYSVRTKEHLEQRLRWTCTANSAPPNAS